MIKRLSKVDDGLGLVIEPSLLEHLGIDENSLLEVVVEGASLVVRLQTPNNKARIRASTKRMMVVHDETLRELAK